MPSRAAISTRLGNRVCSNRGLRWLGGGGGPERSIWMGALGRASEDRRRWAWPERTALAPPSGRINVSDLCPLKSKKVGLFSLLRFPNLY